MNSNEPISMGEWVLTILLTAIPCICIIMLFVWAFGDTKNTKPSKSNYAKASLIWMAIGIAISIVFSSAITAIVTAAMSQMYY